MIVVYIVFIVLATIFIRTTEASAPDREVDIPLSIIEDPVKSYAYREVVRYFGALEWEAFNSLIKGESGWNYIVRNKTTGACGIGQANPCEKMGLGDDWQNYEKQIDWTIQYVNDRYGTPTKAYQFWLSKAEPHPEQHWY